MTQYIRVGSCGDFPEGAGRCVEVEGRRIAIFRLDGTLHALDDTCTHALASLSEGEVNGEEVACPLHFATFNIKTGRCTGPPASEDAATYPVRSSGDDVEVQL